MYFLSATILILTLADPPGQPAAAPIAVFSANAGFGELTLSDAGKPIDAVVEIRGDDARPHLGETDEGVALFPLPPGESFLVELKIGDKSADPIRLFRTANGVEPSRVSVTFGLRPCCRSKLPRAPIIEGVPEEAPPAEDETPPYGTWAAVSAIFAAAWLTAVGALYLIKRQTRQLQASG